MDTPSTPAERIRCLMNQDNLSQRELSVKANVNESLISKYLASKSKPSPKFLVRLEDVLHWSCRWIRIGKGPQRWTNEMDGKPVDITQLNKGVELLEQAVESLKAAAPQQFPK